jgi:cysteine desulfurase family protein (TIGR01976 family)
MTHMTFDVDKIRADFPALKSGLAFFDGPGGSQVPSQVGRAISEAITKPISNRNVVTQSERNAEEIVINFRQAVADLINADPGGVVYGRSWTQITYDFSRTLAKTWSADDEIIVTNLDHDSNIRPWVQAAESVGAVVRWAKIDPETGELPTSAISELLTAKTRLVAVTGAGNTLGTRPDIKAISAAVHQAGALLYVDGVHLTPHTPIDVQEIGADFFGFSFYKLFGPHCAALAADPQLLKTLNNDKLLPATSAVPERFEFGTLPYELMAGSTAAIDYIADMVENDQLTRRGRILHSVRELERYEEELFAVMEFGIQALPRVTTYGHAKKRTPTVYFNLEGYQGAEVYKHLADLKVNAPAGNFYALEVSRALGLGDTGAVRVGLAPYSTLEDVARLLDGLHGLIK